MNELNKEEIRKIAYNCKKATFLIEKKQTGTLTLREKLELKIHLTGCSVCRIFEKQSILINKMMRVIIDSSQPKEIKLDETFKTDLQNIINEKLNKN